MLLLYSTIYSRSKGVRVVVSDSVPIPDNSQQRPRYKWYCGYGAPNTEGNFRALAAASSLTPRLFRVNKRVYIWKAPFGADLFTPLSIIVFALPQHVQVGQDGRRDGGMRNRQGWVVWPLLAQLGCRLTYILPTPVCLSRPIQTRHVVGLFGVLYE